MEGKHLLSHRLALLVTLISTSASATTLTTCDWAPPGISNTLCQSHADGASFPYAYNCTAFVHCIEGCPHLQYCPPGRQFNSLLEICDIPGGKRCAEQPFPMPSSSTAPITRTTLPPNEASTICRNAPSHMLIPYAGDCSMFVECLDGTAYLHSCPTQHLFNPAMGICDLPENVQCFKASTDTPITTPEMTTTTIAMSTTQAMETAKTTTTTKARATTNAGTSITLPATSSTTSSTTTTKSPEERCAGVRAGTTFPYTEDCQYYWFCTGAAGSGTKMPCPRNNFYDPYTGNCGPHVPSDACRTPVTITTAAPQSPESLCKDQPMGKTFPMTGNCNQYVYCLGYGKSLVLQCPRNNYFDVQSGNCGPNVAPMACLAAEITPLVAVAPEESPEEDDLNNLMTSAWPTFTGGVCHDYSSGQLVSYPEKCHLYILCVYPVPVAYQCSNNYSFDETMQVCLPPAAANCSQTDGSISESLSTALPETTSPATTDSTAIRGVTVPHVPNLAGICASHPLDSFVPYPNNCSKFIHCVEPMPIAYSCEGNSEFNVDLQICTAKAFANCSSVTTKPKGSNTQTTVKPSNNEETTSTLPTSNTQPTDFPTAISPKVSDSTINTAPTNAPTTNSPITIRTSSSIFQTPTTYTPPSTDSTTDTTKTSTQNTNLPSTTISPTISTATISESSMDTTKAPTQNTNLPLTTSSPTTSTATISESTMDITKTSTQTTELSSTTILPTTSTATIRESTTDTTKTPAQNTNSPSTTSSPTLQTPMISESTTETTKTSTQNTDLPSTTSSPTLQPPKISPSTTVTTKKTSIQSTDLPSTTNSPITSKATISESTSDTKKTPTQTTNLPSTTSSPTTSTAMISESTMDTTKTPTQTTNLPLTTSSPTTSTATISESTLDTTKTSIQSTKLPSTTSFPTTSTTTMSESTTGTTKTHTQSNNLPSTTISSKTASPAIPTQTSHTSTIILPTTNKNINTAHTTKTALTSTEITNIPTTATATITTSAVNPTTLTSTANRPSAGTSIIKITTTTYIPTTLAPTTHPSTTSTSNACSDQPSGTSVPYPTDCSMYILCVNSAEEVARCMSGNYYDPTTGKCARDISPTACQKAFTPTSSASTTTAISSIATRATTTYTQRTTVSTMLPSSNPTALPTLSPDANICYGKPQGALLPYPGNSTRYIICHYPLPIVANCSKGKVFDKSREDCVHAGIGQPTTNPVVVVTTTTPSQDVTDPVALAGYICRKAAAGATFAYPGDCTRYSFCFSEEGLVLKCDSDWYFDPNLRLCVPRDRYKCPW